MTPGELLVVGITAGVILCSLLNELLRWTTSSHDMLTALSTAILLDLAITGRRGVDLAPIALAFIGALAVLHAIRKE
jgi:hypothetical protein